MLALPLCAALLLQAAPAGHAARRHDGGHRPGSSLMVKPLSERFGVGATIVIGLCGSALGFALLPLIPAGTDASTAVTMAAYAIVVFWLDCGAMLFFMPYIERAASSCWR
jgi:uncharacterized membrane protein YeaQ/YmgE (transglycosylase-associated protein family)